MIASAQTHLGKPRFISRTGALHDHKTADAVMSHGVQLPVFEALSPVEAHREFQRELATMRALCLKLLEQKQLVA